MTGDKNTSFGVDDASLGRAVSPSTISTIIDDNETAGGAFISPEGLSRVEDGQRRHVDIPVLLVVTDRRILFVSAADGTPGEDAGDLSYGDIATVSVGAVTDRQLEIATTDGVSWQYRFPEGVEGAVDGIARHLTWVGTLRSEVLRLGSDVELAAGEMQEAAAAREYDAATATYDRVRSSVDQLIGRVQLTEPIADDVLAPELTDIERILEDAHARLYIERARSRLELGDQLLAVDRHEQADSVLTEARADYERARDVGEAVRRGDAFQFGRQRRLNEELDRLRWDLEMVAAEPIRQARAAKLAAELESDRELAAESWESAFHQYDYAQTLDWTAEGPPLDPKAARREMETAAEQSIRLRVEVARERWESGFAHVESGEQKAALTGFQDAKDHLDQAHELAVAIESGSADEIADHLDRVEDTLEQLRTDEFVDTSDDAAESDAVPAGDGGSAVDTEDRSASSVQTAESDASSGASDESAADLPSLRDLEQLDTHHEIALPTDDDSDRWMGSEDAETRESRTEHEERTADEETVEHAVDSE
ncbi:hypothetical protein [Halovenus marina]|uniref:hypothetical protein n=1 Tax=Halovenus marina TaxID=3396621 RepID=UPI003F559C89